MAERKLTANDYLLFIDPAGGTSYKLIICQTDGGIDRTTSVIDAKSKCGPDKSPGTQDITITMSGQIMWDADTGEASEGDLHSLWANKTTVGWKWSKAGTLATDDVSYSGTGFISKLSAKFSQDNPGTFDLELSPYGTITQTITP